MISETFRKGTVILGPALRLNPFAWHMQIEAHRAHAAGCVDHPAALGIRRHPTRAAGQIAAGFWAGAAGEGRLNFIDTHDVARRSTRGFARGIRFGVAARLSSDAGRGLDHAAG